jgi:hypothetical protein
MDLERRTRPEAGSRISRVSRTQRAKLVRTGETLDRAKFSTSAFFVRSTLR